MVDPATLATIVAACLASLFMAWTIGAGSSGSTPFAPAVGARAISVMRAGFFVGIFGLLGAVLQGENVSEAIGRELISGVTLTPEAASIALLTAGTLVAVGVFTGYPIATAFTVTGAVISVGFALGGAPAWMKWFEIATLWILTPFIGAGLAYWLAKTLRRDDIADIIAVPALAAVVGAVVANLEFMMLGPAGDGRSIAQMIAQQFSGPSLIGIDLVVVGTTLLIAMISGGLLWHDMHGDVHRGEQRFLLVLGALVAFSAGGSQVGLAVGPLLPLLEPFSISLWAILLGGGLGLLLGSWTGAPRMIKAIAQDYSSLGPRRSIAALIPAFLIAQIAILFGIPVSFNEIVVSAVIGSGLAVGTAGVSRRKMVNTVGAWVGSLFGSVVIGYTLLSVVIIVLAQ